MSDGMLHQIDPGSSVLLLGSGFSLDATNIREQAPPNGAGLRKHFIAELGLPADTTYDLRTLSEEFAVASESALFKEIYELFTIAATSPTQDGILSEPWFRIYTTNYDDVAEVALAKTHRKFEAYTASDPLPNRFPVETIVHLHGAIGRASDESVLDQIVLGESAYVRQYISKSPWYTQFQADIKYATNLIIIGYSLSDYHISALLLESPHLKERTFFVGSATSDAVFKRRVAPYGSALPIGAGGFYELLTSLPRPSPIPDASELKSFRRLDPIRDRKALRPPTALETQRFLVFGTFNYSRCVATLPEQTYVISRHNEVNVAVELISKNRSLVVDGRLGNGKTIFLFLLFFSLAERGYNCFLFKGFSPNIDAELDALAKIDKVVLFFDEYATAQDVLPRVAQRLPNAKLVIEVRTSIFEVRYHEVSSATPGPFARIGLNRLSNDDVAAFGRLCAGSGISVPAQPLSRPDLRDLLSSVLESRAIKERLQRELAPVFSGTARKKVLLLSMLLAKFHLSADPGFIRVVTGVDPYHEFHAAREIAEELFDTGLDEFRMRSSIFGEFTVRHLLSVTEIKDCVIDTALEAAARKTSRVYRVLMANLMQYTNLEDLFHEIADPARIVIEIYERLRYDERINDEPLFWLQYSIAAAATSDLDASERFINRAYERAGATPGFRTYQIDTHALRVLLLVEAKAAPGTSVTRLPEILEKLQLVDAMLAEESHRAFAIRVLQEIRPFVERRRNALTSTEKTALTFWLAQIAATLGRLPEAYRAATGSDAIRQRLEATIPLLY